MRALEMLNYLGALDDDGNLTGGCCRAWARLSLIWGTSPSLILVVPARPTRCGP